MALRDLILRVVPKPTAEAMEAESRAWLMTCSECGHSVSVWDAGGLRYKAAGEPRRRARCAGCGDKTCSASTGRRTSRHPPS